VNRACRVGLAVLLLLAWAGVGVTADGPLDTARIEQLSGLKGQLNQRGDVFKLSAPRTDAAVHVSGWPLPPFMGLTSWAAFTPAPGGAMVMGDIVLFQDEVNPALDAALASGLAVSALHNHFFYDQPKVYFMHITGQGSPDVLATAVRRVLEAARRVRQARPAPALGFGGPPLPERSAISPQPIEEALGEKAQVQEGMVKVVVGRQTRMECCEVGADMGVNTWAAFAGTDQDAVVDGDFAVTEDELQPTLRALRQAQIDILAIHNHMVHEQPRIIFLHYWGRGTASDLARGVRQALDVQKGGPAAPH